MRAVESLRVGDAPAVWKELGFALDGDECHVSGVRLLLGADEPGLTDLQPASLDEVDDLPLTPEHPNGVRDIDHVVLLTPHLDRTIEELTADGLDLRRVRDAGNGMQQAFFRLGPVILEVVGDTDDGEPRLWGITFTVRDLDAPPPSSATACAHRRRPCSPVGASPRSTARRAPPSRSPS